MIRTRLLVVLALAMSFAACTKENITPTEEVELDLGKENLVAAEQLTVNEKRRNVLLFKVENAKVTAGSSFCVDVRSAGFRDIVSWQYSVAWDDAVLAFSHVDNFNLPGLDASSFGNPQSDRLTTAWIDLTLAGASVPRGTPLYSICFDAIGNPGDRTPVSITDNPTDIEVINTNFENVSVWSLPGRVRLR
ncbi:MAG: hypothetical protein HRU41_01200 [Saprospiraceae bacterium]|nr:hypothetical protein [Saprospiraceae bacterium]